MAEPSPTVPPSEKAPMTRSTRAPQVFVSYARDSVAHVEQVQDFVTFLRSEGVDAHIDLGVVAEAPDWMRWIVQQLENADCVLAIASPSYRRSFEVDQLGDVSRGVALEVKLIRDIIVSDPSSALRRIVPVVLPGGSVDGIPRLLQPYSATHYPVSAFTVAGAEGLLRFLHNRALDKEGIPATHGFSSAALRVLRGSLADADSHPITLSRVFLAALRRPPEGRDDVAAGLAAGLARIRGLGRDDFAKSLASELQLPHYRESNASTEELAAHPGFEEVMLATREMQSRLGQGGPVHLRHLVGAAVATGLEPPVMEALHTTDVELRELLIAVIQERLAGESAEAWRSALIGSTGTPSARRQVLIGGHTADLVDPEQGIPLDRDDLGVRTYVMMLASLIAHRDTPLPLSIGLFGQWGSGKSYFMGLLRDRIAFLGKQGNGYHTDIVQIGFNAWTYADADLWASLGDTIFTRLSEWGTEGDVARLTQRRAELRDRLESTTSRARELTDSRDRANTEAAVLRSELEQRRVKRDRSAADLLAAALSVFSRNAKSNDDLKRTLHRLGIDDTVEQASLLADQIRGLRDERRLWWTSLTSRWAVGVMTLLVAGLLLLAGSSVISYPQLTTTGGLATLTAAVTWAMVGVTRIRSSMQTLTRIAQEIRDERSQRGDANLQAAVNQLRQAEAESQVMQAQLDQVLARAGEIGRELADLAPGERLYSFLAQRAASADYRARLSLISTIRRDFQTLIGLMKEWAAESRVDGNPAHRPVDRIVLYIDDLDRCTPRQVVDVLQAVHLMLALDLFVVVVGVDPRWLLHSLQDQYHSILHTNEIDAIAWRSTPHDYLEKIFNIPFILPGISPAGFNAMVQRLAVASPYAAPVPYEHVSPPPLDVSKRPAPSPTNLQNMPSELPEIAIDLTPLQPVESQLLAALAPLVSSPRSATRLLNLYRMLRSTEDLSEASRFLGGPDGHNGEFQAVALLLGIQTAAPELFNRLITARSEPAIGAVGGLQARLTDQTWESLVDGLTPRQIEGRWQNDLGNLSIEERDAWLHLLVNLRNANTLISLNDIGPLRTWATHVARFSFHL